MKQKTFLVLMALIAVCGSVKADPTGSWATDTYGITGDYDTDNTFYIHNERQMAGFAALVNSGYDFSNKTVILKYDIDLGEHYWVPIGNTYAYTFQGTFDGGGHTIKNIITAAPTGDDGKLAGLFGKLGKDGTIKNLKISNSTILGKNYLGGIAAYNDGGTITNCIVESSVTITDYNSGGFYFGGIAGAGCGIISGCVSRAQFDIGSNNNMYDVGGILGYSEINTYEGGRGSKVIDCIFFGSTLPEHSTGETQWKLVGPIIGKIQTSDYVHTNNYFTTSGLPNSSRVGNVAYAVKSENPSFTLNFDGDPTATYNISNISSYSNGLKYGSMFYAKSGEKVKFKVVSKSDNVTVGTVYANGTSLTADNGFYSVTIGSEDVTITADLSISGLNGDGTAGSPYEITTATDWETFASIVASGYSFSGQYVQLTSNISLTFEEKYNNDGSLPATPHLVGTNENRFAGTFDGGGHTITLDQTIRRNYTPGALFRYVRNVTIKNLIVDGSFTNSMYAIYNTGLVAVADGESTISNCLVLTSVKTDAASSSVGNAGIVGQLQNTSGMTNSLTMTGCAFLGKLLKYDDDVPTRVGGLLGYASAGTTATFTDCLFDPAEITVGTTGSSTLARYDGDATLTFSGCYYTKLLGEAQGTSVAINSDATAAGSAGTSHGYITPYTNGLCLSVNSGSTYYTPTQSPGTETTISLSDGSANSSTLWVNKGRTVNVTLNGRTFTPNEWNTLCLPFAMNTTQIAASPLADATFMELDFDDTYGGAENYTHFDTDNGTLYLYFKDATEIKAGKPYIVKPTSEITSPTFNNVTITTSTASTESAEVGVSFVGTFDPAPLTAGSSLNLYVGANNTLYYPSGVSSFSVRPFRAYFVVDPSESGVLDPENGVRGIYMNLDDEASSIREIESESIIRNSEFIYDLNGRKLSESVIRNSGLKRGLYIKNGRKYIVK